MIRYIVCHIGYVEIRSKMWNVNNMLEDTNSFKMRFATKSGKLLFYHGAFERAHYSLCVFACVLLIVFGCFFFSHIQWT